MWGQLWCFHELLCCSEELRCDNALSLAFLFLFKKKKRRSKNQKKELLFCWLISLQSSYGIPYGFLGFLVGSHGLEVGADIKNTLLHNLNPNPVNMGKVIKFIKSLSYRIESGMILRQSAAPTPSQYGLCCRTTISQSTIRKATCNEPVLPISQPWFPP